LVTYDTFDNFYLSEREILENYPRLIIMLYFALTTLSTVGYGDYHPISNLEMMFASLIMMGGVAFFSYIMGNFLEIVSNYSSKMGSLDRSDELNEWIVSLERFTQGSSQRNIPISLINNIILS
jgi:hypothetical protein